MIHMLNLAATLAVLAVLAFPGITALPHSRPFDAVKRQSNSSSNSLQVDLGYHIYEGVANTSTGLNTFKGIRFAEPPLGSLRWQPPLPPSLNRSSVLSATEYGPSCPQTPNSGSAFVLPDQPVSEDCLFLSVYSPANATNLPVLVWIHGGGYGAGDGKQDLSALINSNNNSFVAVSLQYRLGAFGFLSSDEVFRKGITNAGLYDQQFGLQWVQAYIELFGGDPTQVTISGISAGGGSVMLHDIAYGGQLGTSLFRNSITGSPYLPQQYGYKDWIPSQSYYAFATHAGCPPSWAYGNSSQAIFECLQRADSGTLIQASQIISASGTYGSWSFLPVTDGALIQSTPSEALLKHRVNGINQLSGNCAEEGPYFTTQNITTEQDLVDWIKLVFPLFSNDDIAKLLYYYPTQNSTNSSSLPRFATSGNKGATALDTGSTASGQQQRADLIYGETTFICPSYWAAEAYNTNGRAGYKYQYSVPLAMHGSDMYPLFGDSMPNLSPDLTLAYQTIWGNFIKTGNPSIPSSIANGASSNGTARNELENWPAFTLWSPQMANLNETGGREVRMSTGLFNYTSIEGPGLRNDLAIVDAYSWEAARGVRCDFWRSVASIVPE